MGKDEQAKNPRGCEERELRRERRTFRRSCGRAARDLGRGQTWRGGESAETAQRARQAACAGEDRTPPRPRHGLSGALVPGGLRYVRRKGSRGGDSHGGWGRGEVAGKEERPPPP